MAETTPKSYSADPTLYLYTSLTAGSSHIITATSRLETILKANKIPFKALDVATDEKARMLWGRRSKGKKLPGLVKFGSIIGDLEEVEEWNEYGELKQQVGTVPAVSITPTVSKEPPPSAPSLKAAAAPTSDSEHIQIREPPEAHRKSSATAPKKDDTPLTMAMRQAGADAAAKAGQKKVIKPGSLLSENPTSPDAPAPITEIKLGKASEDIHASPEMTAAKTPNQLAAEGAGKTSVDKIPDSESGAAGEIEPTSSREEALLQARRTSSITKTKTPLSTETAVESSPSTKEHFEPPPRLHRGSSVSEASKEEIDSIEKAQMIPEEDEEEGDSKGTSGNSPALDEGGHHRTIGTTSREQDARQGEVGEVSVGD